HPRADVQLPFARTGDQALQRDLYAPRRVVRVHGRRGTIGGGRIGDYMGAARESEALILNHAARLPAAIMGARPRGWRRCPLDRQNGEEILGTGIAALPKTGHTRLAHRLCEAVQTPLIDRPSQSL